MIDPLFADEERPRRVVNARDQPCITSQTLPPTSQTRYLPQNAVPSSLLMTFMLKCKFCQLNPNWKHVDRKLMTIFFK